MKQKALLSFACIFFCASLLLTGIAYGEIYTWKDKNGKLHFSDEPPPEKQKNQVNKVKLKEVTTLNFTRVTSAVNNPRKRKPRQKNDDGYVPDVVMYSTTWCSVCKTAKKFFRNNNIAFVELDIESDPSALREYQQLNGRGVPLILVDDYKMEGFNASRFMDLYEQ